MTTDPARAPSRRGVGAVFRALADPNRRRILDLLRKAPRTTGDLAAHLDDPAWVVVDVRYSLADTSAGLAQYREGHIAGAVYASLSHDLASTPTGANGRHPLPSPDAMAAAFGRLGIGPGTQVVCYDADNMFAARLWWMLRFLGHDAVAVLDGGFPKWVKEGRPVRSGEDHRASATFTPAVCEDMRVPVETVAAASRNGSLSQPAATTRKSHNIQGRRRRWHRARSASSRPCRRR